MQNMHVIFLWLEFYYSTNKQDLVGPSNTGQVLVYPFFLNMISFDLLQ